MEYESHYKSCPFYKAWKVDERKHGPRAANKTACSYCERKRQEIKQAEAATDIDDTQPLNELGRYF